MEILALPLTHPLWEKIALPHLHLVKEPRAWSDLEPWAEDRKVPLDTLRQSLAWLEANHYVKAYRSQDHTWFWRAIDGWERRVPKRFRKPAPI